MRNDGGSMTLTVGTRIVADVRILDIAIVRQIGAYDLQFIIQADVRSKDPDEVISAKLYSADVTVKVSDQAAMKVGCAHPKVPLHLKPGKYSLPAQTVFSLQLTSHQVSMLEAFREASDVDFELTAYGLGETADYKQSVQDSWRFNIPRSKWLTKLNEASYSETLLLEISMPTDIISESWKTAADALKRAHEKFNNADYVGCVSDCRIVVEEIGARESGTRNWATSALQALAGSKKDMNKGDRLLTILASIRNYTHMAHHAESEGGESKFKRNEAKFILALTADVLVLIAA